jgi:uncharacterized protein YjaZ
MKIEIELDERNAACAWANQTIWGKYPKTMQEIISHLMAKEASEYRMAFPENDPQPLFLSLQANHQLK